MQRSPVHAVKGKPCRRRFVFLILGLLLISLTYVVYIGAHKHNFTSIQHFQFLLGGNDIHILPHGSSPGKTPLVFVKEGERRSELGNEIYVHGVDATGQNIEKVVTRWVKEQKNTSSGLKTSIHLYKSKRTEKAKSNGEMNIKIRKSTASPGAGNSELGASPRTNTSLIGVNQPLNVTRKHLPVTLSVSNQISKTNYTNTLKEKPSKSAASRPSHYAAMTFQGRLGNHMFEYASLLGIARENNLIPLTSGDTPLRTVFKIEADSAENQWFLKYTRNYEEAKGCTYEPAAMQLGSTGNVKLRGYFQSWKYLTEVDGEVRKQFQFQNNIADKATLQFLRIVRPKLKNYNGNIAYVAVHVRRGDMESNKPYVKYGYVSPGPDYTKRGMEKFRSLYKNCLFVVASDDLKWCKENFQADDIVYVESGNEPEVDMAILTHCDHTLMTVGSFGWWVAWLNNGTTIYYKGYPTPGSELAKLFNSDDYRPPNWIGIM